MWQQEAAELSARCASLSFYKAFILSFCAPESTACVGLANQLSGSVPCALSPSSTWGGDRFYQVEQPAAPVPKAGKFLKCSPMRRGGLMLSVWFFLFW